MTSHALGGLAAIRRTVLYMLQSAAGGRHGDHLEMGNCRQPED